MARASINDFRDNLEALEGADRKAFLKAHAKIWQLDITRNGDDYEDYKNALDGEGSYFADYVLSFTGSAKGNKGVQALLDWLNEAAEKGLVDSPYEEEETEEEEEKPTRGRRRVVREEEEEDERPARKVNKVNKKKTVSRKSRDDDEPRGRGRRPLSEDKIEEIRDALRETQSITEAAKVAEVSVATIMKYVDADEREELGVRVNRRREEEDERPARKAKTSTREVSTGRGRTQKESSRGRATREEPRGRRSTRTTRGR